MKLQKGDEIKIVSGKDKGKQGKVEKILPKENMVIVAGFNQYKRHIKAKTQMQKSEIITLTKPLPVANVSLICPKCHLPTRVGYTEQNSKKVRICKKCDQEI